MHTRALFGVGAIVVIFASASQAACPPPYSASGHATYYAAGGQGACSLQNVDGETTAIVYTRWNGSAHCGECLQVTGPLGSTIVKVTDECPDCDHSELDMSQGAFAKIGALPDGVIPISWQRVDCPVGGGLKLQVKDGVNPYWFTLLADGTRQGIAAMRAKEHSSSVWQPLTRLDYGYFNFTSSTGLAFPLSIELTSVSGEVLQLSDAIHDATASVTYSRAEQFSGCDDRIFAGDFGSSG
jgi:expansin (peptidoglycan-binding protein)